MKKNIAWDQGKKLTITVVIEGLIGSLEPSAASGCPPGTPVFSLLLSQFGSSVFLTYPNFFTLSLPSRTSVLNRVGVDRNAFCSFLESPWAQTQYRETFHGLTG